MSSDLHVVRTTPVLSWAEVLGACDEVARHSVGVTFWDYRGDHSGATNAYFWDARRVSVAVRIPEPDEIEDDAAELGAPYVELSSGSRAWPWLEWMAYALARPLRARIFDPQEGSFFALPQPEHDLVALRRMHDEYLRQHTPSLAQVHWAFDVGEPTPEGLRARVAAVEAVARDVLGIDRSISLRDGSMSVWQDYPVGEDQLRVSIEQGYGPKPEPYLHVTGPASEARVRAFADALARRMGIRFNSRDEYT